MSTQRNDLRPVSFRYKDDIAGKGADSIEYGLVAKEVAESFPTWWPTTPRDGRSPSATTCSLLSCSTNCSDRTKRSSPYGADWSSLRGRGRERYQSENALRAYLPCRQVLVVDGPRINSDTARPGNAPGCS